MLDYVHMRLVHVAEALRTTGIRPLIKELIFRDRVAVVVKKDLKGILPNFGLPKENSAFCAEITLALFDDAGVFNQFKNRELKAFHYLRKGFRGFGLFMDNEIVADLWYYWPSPGLQASIPKDLEWLGLSCPVTDVYSFDMFLNPKLRGQNLAAFFQGSFLKHLRDLGAEKAYGFYWLDNLPALWVHRMLKWEEIKRLKIRRFFAYRKAKVSKSSSHVRLEDQESITRGKE